MVILIVGTRSDTGFDTMMRKLIYIAAGIIGSLVGFLADKAIYPDGGTTLMKIGFVLGLCVAYMVLNRGGAKNSDGQTPVDKD